jgi:hypothetical protein
MHGKHNSLIILQQFTRHDRDYWVFSIRENPHTFLYFSHREKDLRALFYGTSFTEKIPRIEKEHNLCIECGLSTLIKGGVSLDGEDLVAFNCEREGANRIISQLRKYADNSGALIQDL